MSRSSTALGLGLLLHLLIRVHHNGLHVRLRLLHDGLELWSLLESILVKGDHEVVVVNTFSQEKLVHSLHLGNLGGMLDLVLGEAALLRGHDETGHCASLLHLDFFNVSESIFHREHLVSFGLVLDAFVGLDLSCLDLEVFSLLRFFLEVL